MPAPLRFAGNLAGDWKRFRGQWTNYAKAVKLNSESGDRQAAIFLACIGAEAYELFETFEFSQDDDREDLQKIMDAFEAHCIGEVNVVYERYVFYQRKQENGETFDNFLSDLRKLVKTCDFGTVEDSTVRDRIVMGIRDDATRRKLLQSRKLDLKTAIDICRASESATKHLRAMSKPDDVHAIHAEKQRGARARSSSRKPKNRNRASTPGRRCQYCDRIHDSNKASCPAYGKTCKACGRRNHFASVCRSKDKSSVCELDDGDSDTEVLALDGQRPSRWYSRLNVAGRTVRFLLDCGATVNLLPASLVEQLGSVVKNLRRPEVNLRMFDESQLKTVGMLSLPVTHPTTGQFEHVDFYIAEKHNQPLLGIEACLKFDLLNVNHDNICSIDASAPLTMDEVDRDFADIFEGYGKLEGQVSLKVDQSVQPVRMPLRKLPIPIRDRVADELQHLEDSGIIVRVTKPTEWTSALLVVSKANGGVRPCIDPTPLNRALMRDHYAMPTIDDILPNLTKAKIFSTMDAKCAFWHLELDEDSSFLTTFLTPWGKFRWTRLPYGVSPAPELFQRRMHEALAGLKGVACIADDILVYGCGDTLQEAQQDHDGNVRQLMSRCREKNLKLNKSKFRLNRKSVTFMGHVLTDTGLRVCNKKVDAIHQMPVPTDRQGVLRLLGMATYLARYTPGFSEMTAPLRQLLKRDSEFRWDDTVHGAAVDKIKNALANAPVLRYYDLTKDVTVQCDSSQSGMGAVMLQDGHPVEFASRALTQTEQSYAQIEKELLAVCFAMERMHAYVYGRTVRVETDHKPLISIVRKPLTSAPKRLQRMLLRLQRYNIDLVYRPGSEVVIADTLSRAYAADSAVQTKFTEELATLEAEQEAESHMVASTETLQKIKQSAEEDDVYAALKRQIASGWPSDPAVLPEELQSYLPFADELVTLNNFIYKGNRILIPTGARQWIMERVHRSHIGINGCLRRAREVVFWPGMTTQLKEWIAKCHICQTYQTAGVKEPLLSHEAPARPWQKVGVDIFTFRGKDYLITADYSSSYFEVDRLQSKRVKDIVYSLKGQFARHGVPEIVFSDNSPFMAGEFQRFAKLWEFTHQTSSPRYPVSNGKVENAVKTAKMLMTKALEDHKDPFLALLDWRNTPSETLKLSPAQIMFGRRTRTLMPTSNRLLETPSSKQNQAALTRSKVRQAEYYNRHAKQRPPLAVGQTVRFKVSDDTDSWEKGEIAETLPYRSYNIRLQDGSTRRRTSKHVRFSPEPPIVLDDCDSAPMSSENTPDRCSRSNRRPNDAVSKRRTPGLIKGNDAVTDAPAIKPAQHQTSIKPAQPPPPPTVTRSGRQVIRPARYR